ncbi:MAG TPA: M23 family metallopeptidase [Gammaproteobacteria bacterium]
MNYSNFINKDIRNRQQPRRHPRLRWMILAMGCALLGVVLANTRSNPESTDMSINAGVELDTIIENAVTTSTDTASNVASIRLELPKTKPGQTDIFTTPPLARNEFKAEYDWAELKVRSGDSLSSLFDKAKIKPSQLIELLQLGDSVKTLTRLHPGEVIKVESNNDGELTALHYELENFQYLRVIRTPEGLAAETIKHNIETRTAYASATIDSSLFMASQNAGLSQNLTMELASIFGWDIDFVLDIRQGDRFTIIYEEIFKNGEKVQDGNILAAEFINQDTSHRALRYTEPTTGETGYYTPDGQSMRKAFLRSPVEFSRISSGFTNSRYHPLLHKIRSHKGVDYAAPRGTPVRASGDGKVIFRGKKGGYGNVVILKHGNIYSTLYAHLSSFNRKIYNGGNVKQGQVIGYVGSTGLASGPHLHYEFRLNGVHRNPLTVKFPSTSPIPERYRDNFELTTQEYLAQLDVLARNALALNQN